MPVYPALGVEPVNIRSVMGQIAQEKSQAFRDRLSGERFDFEKQQYADAQGRENRLTQARGAYMGSETAFERYAAMDPAGAKILQDITAQASDEQWEQIEKAKEEAMRKALYIAKVADDKPKRESRWKVKNSP